MNLVAERDKQIAALTADNAALRELLERVTETAQCLRNHSPYMGDAAKSIVEFSQADKWLPHAWHLLEHPEDSHGADLLKRHAEELAGARKLADCWTKAETALNDMAMERDALRLRHAEELAGVIANYVHDHSLTCDCCQHVMIDVTAESAGGDGRSHCIAGDPEGEGVACAHGMAKDMEALRQRAEAAEERENRLDRLAEAQDGALAAVTEKISALTKERDEATARANAAREALDKIADFELGGGDPWKAVTFLQEIAEMPLAEATEPVAQSEGGK